MKYMVAALAVLLVGCASPVDVVEIRAASLNAKPTGWAQLRPLRVGPVTDKRDAPADLAGRFFADGSPTRELRASAPIADVVGSSFRQGLHSRGAYSVGPSGYTCTVEVLQFFVDRVVRREANIELRVTIQDDKALPVFSKEYAAVVVEGGISDPPTTIENNRQAVRATLESALRQVTDKALDDPALHIALRP